MKKKLIEWSDGLSVEIQELDEQHKLLVDILNRFHQAVITRNDAALINDILQELVQYTIIHFSVEESLMRIFDYPLYEDHKKLHIQLTEQVVNLQNRAKRGEVAASMELWKFLKSWLVKHILVEDKKYTRFFLDRGLNKTYSQQSWVGKIWNYMRPS